MSASTRKIQESAAADNEWNTGDIEVRDFEGIRMTPCAFYTATHKVQPVHAASTYAILPSGAVVSEADEQGIDKILDACQDASRATAAAWAELLARFHWGVGPGTVLYDAKQAPTAIGKLESAGGGFSPPRRVEGPGALSVRFFLMNFETSKLYEISASVRDGKQVTVDKKPVAG